MSRLLFALLFVATSAAAQPSPLTPEQSFDLLARFMLEGDADAGAQVAALTGAPVQGERWEDAVDRIVIGDAPADSARVQAGRELSRQVAIALRQTHCRSIGSERHDGDGLQIAIVAYTCQMPDYASAGDGAAASSQDDPHDDGDLGRVRQVIAALHAAPRRAHADRVILARLGDDDAWVAQDLPPMHRWIQRLLMLPE